MALSKYRPCFVDTRFEENTCLVVCLHCIVVEIDWMCCGTEVLVKLLCLESSSQ